MTATRSETVKATEARWEGPFREGDVVQIICITGDRGYISYEITATERTRTTGYNNVIRSPDGFGRVVAAGGAHQVERDSSLTASDLEATRQAVAARRRREEDALNALKTLEEMGETPRMLQTVNGPIPYYRSRRIPQDEWDALRSRWDEAMALAREEMPDRVEWLIEMDRITIHR